MEKNADVRNILELEDSIEGLDYGWIYVNNKDVSQKMRSSNSLSQNAPRKDKEDAKNKRRISETWKIEEKDEYLSVYRNPRMVKSAN